MNLFGKIGRTAWRGSVCLLALTACKGPWVKEFKQEPRSPNVERPLIAPIPRLDLSANGGPRTINVTLTDTDSNLSCYEAISTHSSDITVVPATFMAVSGTAPNCQVTITPAPGVTGLTNVTLTVTDGKNFSSTTFPVNSYGLPAANATPNPIAIMNRVYGGFTVTGSGGLPPYTYAVASGSLPSGITLNTTTGVVSGTPTNYGRFDNISFRATDAGGQPAATAPFTMYVASYDISFMTGTTVNSALKFARRSAGSYIASNGVLSFLAGGEQPRFDVGYDPLTPPSSARRGLLVEGGRTNLLRFSETFEAFHGTAVSRGTLLSNAGLSPDGKNSNSTRLREDNTNNAHVMTIPSVSKGSTSALPYTFSIFARADGRDGVRLRVGTALADCGLTNAGSAAGSASGAYIFRAAAVRALADGWYRCSLSFTSDTSGTLTPQVSLLNGGVEQYTGTNSGGALLWGAQLEPGLEPTSYIPAKNMLTNSSEIDAAGGWSVPNGTSATVEAGIKDPDGDFNTRRLADSSGNLGVISRSVPISSGVATYVFSIYIKKDSAAPLVGFRLATNDTGGLGVSTAKNSLLAFRPGDGKYSGLNFSGGAFERWDSAAAVKVESVSNDEWWRVAIPHTSDNGNQLSIFIYPAWNTANSLAGNGAQLNSKTSQSGAAVNGAANTFFWGAQLEPGGLPTAFTEYFRTTTTATREPDLLDTVSLPAGPFNYNEGTIVSEVFLNQTPTGTTPVITLSNNSTNNQVTQTYSNALAAQNVISGGTTQLPATKSQAPSGIMRMASGYRYNDLGIAVNGVGGGTSTNANIPVTNTMRLGRSEDGSFFLNGHLRSFVYFPDKVPNALLPGLSNP